MRIWTVVGLVAFLPLFAGCGGGGVELEQTGENPDAPPTRSLVLELEPASASGQKTIIGGFKSMSGMDSETEVVELLDINQVYRKQPGETAYGNIVLERGYTATDDLWTWRKQIENGITTRRNGAVVLYENQVEVVRYEFTEAWPVQWSGPALDHDGAEFTEEITLVVEFIERRQG